MAQLALYRQYRPRCFHELVGQGHITTVLQNQAKSGQFSHAYLFCGPRGTGKTSSAKILSRAVNCLAPENGEPCGSCANCSFAAADNADIIEIDAASNTGVDNVRELIEQAQFMPMQLKYRVFIIDEVHMLSTSAFNALLKTLEEPPAHVIFILATTEPQKLPATVISRCQRFDFHRISAHHIVSCLKSVLAQAGYSIELEGLQLIARAAEGGMRDALSLADQCIAYSGTKVSARDVYDVLGSMESDFLFRIAGELLSGDAAGALRELDGVVRQGRSLSVFCSDLVSHFRILILAKACGSCTELVECTEELMQRYVRQAADADEACLLFASQQLLAVQGELKRSSLPRVLLESVIFRICMPQGEESSEALRLRVARLESALTALEARLASGQTAAPAGSAPAPISAPAAGAPIPASPLPPSFDELPLEAPPVDYVPEPDFEPEVIVSKPVQSAKHPAPEPKREVPAQSSPAKPAQSSPAKAAPVGDSSAEAQQLWERILREVQKQNPMVYIYAKPGRAVELRGDTLVVRFAKADEGKMAVAKTGRNLNSVQTEAVKLRPGISISYVLERVSGDEAELFRLFDGKVTID